MLIDEVDVTVKAGNGGDGIVHFYTDRWRPKGGPDGGNGGPGGSVYFLAVSDVTRLNQFRHHKDVKAESGSNGGRKQSTGKGGQDLVLPLPVGTQITFSDGRKIELVCRDEKILVAVGGRGGLGNFHFRSSINQTPKETTLGERPKEIKLNLQLKLIADVGLIGLPNAGKSSLLNELTPAQAKVANYPFTTIEPNLGVSHGGYIIADIPGLIEGASQGKGLGIRFLKHIERTKLLIHCLPADSVNPLLDYQTIRNELLAYNPLLAKKKEILVITKSDLLDPVAVKNLIKLTHAKLAVSIIDTKSIDKLNQLIVKNLD